MFHLDSAADEEGVVLFLSLLSLYSYDKVHPFHMVA